MKCICFLKSCDASIVDQDIKPAMLLDDEFNGFAPHFLTADVEKHE